MTDQERPVEERNEALDESQQNATNVAAADEQPASAEQPAATTAASAPTTVTDEGDSAPVAEAAPVEAAPDADTASEASATEGESETASTEGASYTPVAEDESGRPRRIKDLVAGMELEGRVTSIALYGIFVDIGVGRDGLVHISEMSDTRIESPSDVVQIGDNVTVRVKSVDPDGRRISLTMRSKERANERRGARRKPELDRERLTELKTGDNVEGTVTGIAPFGVFVDIGVGKDGLVHVSELAEGRVERAEDAVQVGQTYTFKILEIDTEGTRISLSLRRAQRTQRFQQIEKGQILDGKVSGLATFGAFVDIGVGRDGLVHISELSEGRVEKVEDAVKVGDEVKVRVLEVDPQSKRISLTMLLEERPAEAPAAEGSEARAERPRRENREDRPRREGRRPRNEAPSDAAPEVYTTADEPEEFKGDATLEDLLSKFGGSSNSGKRERRRRHDDEEDDLGGERYSRRQRDVIRRTLQQLGDDE